MARRNLQLFRFEVWDGAKGVFFDKRAAYVANEIGNNLHRHNVYEVRMNADSSFPQIVEIVWAMSEKHFLAARAAATHG